MKPRILVVDDEAPIRNMLAFSLDRADMAVEVASDGDQALQRLAEAGPAPDLIVLDWMMPGLDGLQLTRTLRSTPDLKNIPIIMLTARGRETDRTTGLDSGADDYMVKPFSTRELISRVRAVLRRTLFDRNDGCASMLEVGELSLDLQSRRALAGGRALSMGPTEFRLLRLFMTFPGRAWSRGQLLSEIWGNDRAVEERTIDVHIRRLRKALECSGHEQYVQTVRGHGYRFSDVV
ncbi:MAG: phosphate regulon transcriptional regulator PhoB [Wenzhouxiangellaceae bacterium]|nr:phosphate regulon transcriptional regulator PhoB [Wenzhouxiangellaceae bacterium]